MSVQNGLPVNFSFSKTSSDGGITTTGKVLTAMMLQSTEVEGQADSEDVRGPGGDVVSRNHYDRRRHATLRLVVADASKTAAIAATTIANAEKGDFIVVSSCASQPDLVATWEVQDGTKVVGDVTKSAEITIPLIKRTGITAVQS
jgi:hypothetical protein